MNDWNPLENRLRSWKPRAPSPSLKARLFGEAAPAPAREEWSLRPSAWHWLAPAMAMFLLGMFIVGRNEAGLAGTTEAWLDGSFLDQPHLVAYSSATHHSEANSLPVTTFPSTFEWTTERHSLKAPRPMAQTNSLIQ